MISPRRRRPKSSGRAGRGRRGEEGRPRGGHPLRLVAHPGTGEVNSAAAGRRRSRPHRCDHRSTHPGARWRPCRRRRSTSAPQTRLACVPTTTVPTATAIRLRRTRARSAQAAAAVAPPPPRPRGSGRRRGGTESRPTSWAGGRVPTPTRTVDQRRPTAPPRLPRHCLRHSRRQAAGWARRLPPLAARIAAAAATASLSVGRRQPSGHLTRPWPIRHDHGQQTAEPPPLSACATRRCRACTVAQCHRPHHRGPQRPRRPRRVGRRLVGHRGPPRRAIHLEASGSSTAAASEELVQALPCCCRQGG